MKELENQGIGKNPRGVWSRWFMHYKKLDGYNIWATKQARKKWANLTPNETSNWSKASGSFYGLRGYSLKL